MDVLRFADGRRNMAAGSPLARAAVERAAGVRAPADRPSSRRSGEEAGSAARVSVRIRDLELRAAGGPGSLLQFRGYASVTNTGYDMYDMFGPYTEEVAAGAFNSSLLRADLDVPLVLQHQDLRRIARTTNGSLRLSEDSSGLLVEADLDPTDQDVQYIEPKLRSGLIDEMSFKFRINAGEWSPDWSTYRITDVDINRGDVAIVGYGASPHTAGSGLVTPDDDGPLAELAQLSESEQRAALALYRGQAPAVRSQLADLISDRDLQYLR
jgi:HK97 family phage prohead protease